VLEYFRYWEHVVLEVGKVGLWTSINPEKTKSNTTADLSANPTPTSTKAKATCPWAKQVKLQQTGQGEGQCPAPWNWAHSAKGAHTYRKACRSRGIKVAAPPLDSPSYGPLTYPGDIKTLIKSSEGRKGPTLNLTTRLGVTEKDLETKSSHMECK